MQLLDLFSVSQPVVGAFSRIKPVRLGEVRRLVDEQVRYAVMRVWIEFPSDHLILISSLSPIPDALRRDPGPDEPDPFFGQSRSWSLSRSTITDDEVLEHFPTDVRSLGLPSPEGFSLAFRCELEVAPEAIIPRWRLSFVDAERKDAFYVEPGAMGRLQLSVG